MRMSRPVITGPLDHYSLSSKDATYTMDAERQARKVPEVTAWFWVAKVLTTALGESTSDFLVHQLDPYVAVGLGAIGLAATLVLQFSVRRYVPWAYWLTVAMVAVTGTMAADVLHIKFGVPYAVSTALFAVVLTIVFLSWYATEKTLSIHSINTPRREVFYWATVMATFALGTAAGDMTATTLHLGYFTSGILFLFLFAVPGVAYRLVKLNGIVAFWFAYIVTRPLGASFADWMGKPHSARGLGFGDGPVALVLTILLVSVVASMSVSHRQGENEMAA